MIKATCKYSSIAEIPDLESVENYKKIVNPLDYDFCFTKGASYGVFGIRELFGFFHLYLFSLDGDYEIDTGPAVLFDCDWSKLPENWRFRMGKSHSENFEFLPEKLALIDYWFEKYIDEDPEVLKIVEEEINYLRKNSAT